MGEQEGSTGEEGGSSAALELGVVWGLNDRRGQGWESTEGSEPRGEGG